MSHVIPVPCGGSNVVAVGDVVNGICLAGDKGESGNRYILGGQNLTFKEIFTTIAATGGIRRIFVLLPSITRVPVSYLAGYMGSMRGDRLLTAHIVRDMFYYKFYSSECAKNKLGYMAQIPFWDIARQAWDFYREQKLV